jgi:hypothetical protein
MPDLVVTLLVVIAVLLVADLLLAGGAMTNDRHVRLHGPGGPSDRRRRSPILIIVLGR